MNAPSFQTIRLPDGQDAEGTTVLMSLKSENLFEIYNAAEIYDENLSHDSSFDPSHLTVKSIVIDRFCYICIGKSVVILQVGSNAETEMSFELNAPIYDFCQVPGQPILMFILCNGTICFFLCQQAKLTVTTETSLFSQQPESCRVAFGGFGKYLTVCALSTYNDKHCEAKFVKFPTLDVLGRSSSEFVDGMRVIKTVSDMSLCYMAADEENFVFFPHRKDTTIKRQCIFALYQPQLQMQPLTSTGFLVSGARAVRSIGKLTAVLLESLDCLLFSEFESLISCGTIRLGKFKGDVIDFTVLDFDGSFLQPTLRLVLHVNDGRQDKILLTHVQGLKTDFEFAVSHRVCLNSATAHTDLNNNIVILEAFSEKYPNTVRVRFIFEAQPEIRLRNLLEKGRFEEALVCAKIHKLPLDKVYAQQIRFLIENVQRDGQMTNSELEKLMTLLHELARTKEEDAVDCAFLAVTTSTQYKHIYELLKICQQYHTSDEEIKENVEKVKYALECYKSLFGDTASFGRDSFWPYFSMGDNHWEIFVQFLENQQIEKCGRLFADYRNSMSSEWINNSHEFFPVLLRHLENTIITSHGLSSQIVSNFLEKDLLPPFFTADHLDYLLPFQSQLMEFLEKVSLSLWNVDQAHYPENALYFSSTFSRVVKTQLARDGDTSEKHWIANCLMKLDVGIAGFSSSLERVAMKLERLCHLKSKYHFIASYETFCTMKPEDVGNELLDKVHSVRNAIEYVKETVFAYCSEFKLERDLLLLNYIKQADLSKIVSICIEMCKLFHNQDYCSKAAMVIAPSCELPWSSDATHLFDRLLKISDLPDLTIRQLRETVLCGEISEILKRYGAPGMLKIDNKLTLLDNCYLICKKRDTNLPIAQRVNDIFKICKLSTQNPRIYLTPNECFSKVIQQVYLISEEMDRLEETLSLLSYIDDEDLRHEISMKVANYAYLLLSSNGLTKVWESRIPLRVNFLMSVSEYLPTELKSNYIKRAYSVKLLYEIYNTVVPADYLDNEEHCPRILRELMDTNLGSTLNDVLNIGELLRRPKEKIVSQRIQWLIEKDAEIEINNTLNTIASIFDKLDDEVIHSIRYAIDYLLLKMATNNFTTSSLSSSVEIIEATALMVYKLSGNTEFYSDFLPVVEFCRFLKLLLCACKLSKSANEGATKPESTMEDIAFNAMEDRLGLTIYDTKQEPMVENVSSIIWAACQCAPTIYGKLNQSKLDNQTCCSNWLKLFEILNDQKQDFLLVSAYQVVSRQEFFDGQVEKLLQLYDQSVVRLLGRILSSLHVDWFACAELLGFRGSHRAEIVSTLRQTEVVKLNRVALVHSFFLKFLFAETTKPDARTISQFKRFSWQLELATHDVRVSSKVVDQPERTLSYFVDVLLPPSIVSSLCRSYDCNVDYVLILYAMECCLRHSAMKSKRQSAILNTAREALETVKNPSNEHIELVIDFICKRFCPYDYEAIEMVLNWCQQSCENAEQAILVRQMQTFLSFLSSQKRRDLPIQKELEWYRKRYAGNPEFLNDTLSDSRDLGETVQPTKDTSFIRNPMAAIRLPFQAFLPNNNEKGQMISTEICENQITTKTLGDWTLMALQLPRILPRGRHYFEASSVYSDLRRCLAAQEPCDEKLMLFARTIIKDSSNLNYVLKTVFNHLADVQLSEFKVEVFDELLNVLDEFIRSPREQETPIDLEDLQSLYAKVKSVRNNYFVLNLLNKYHLLDKKTEASAHDASALCKFIFMEITKWNDVDEIARHFDFVLELQKQKLVSLVQIFDEMIFSWLKNSSNVGDISDLSMELSMDTDDGQNIDSTDLAVPYFSTDVTRMAYFLRFRCDNHLADKIKSLKFSNAKEGMEQQIRTLCTVYRALGCEKFEEIFKDGEALLNNSSF
ncbi:Protein ROD-1 [Aphelenchoides besseyi]|nr:Protein ROD-1 [Aphelenchoides besseyi]